MTSNESLSLACAPFVMVGFILLCDCLLMPIYTYMYLNVLLSFTWDPPKGTEGGGRRAHQASLHHLVSVLADKGGLGMTGSWTL